MHEERVRRYWNRDCVTFASRPARQLFARKTQPDESEKPALLLTNLYYIEVETVIVCEILRIPD